MPSVIINDILPRTQAVAVGSQTVYSTNWTANYPSDVVVFSRPAGTDADDATQQLQYPSQYSVAFIGDQATVQVTLVTPSTAGDIVTVIRQTPADRENLYSNTNFTPSMLNNDFGILTLVDQQAQLIDDQVGVHYNYSAIIEPIVDNILPILPANNAWVKNNDNTAIVTYYLPPGGVAPADDTYVTVLDNTGDLPNSFPLSNLGAGLLVNNPAGPGLLSTVIQGTTSQIGVTNGNGIGTIGLFIPNNPIMPGNQGMGIPSGTSSQRVTPTLPNIDLRWNTTLGKIEYYNGSKWVQLSDTSVNIIPAAEFNVAYYYPDGETIDGIPNATNPNFPLVSVPGNAPAWSNIVSLAQINDVNNVEILNFLAAANAVNYLVISNAITNESPAITAAGTDADIRLDLSSKGNAGILLNAFAAVNQFGFVTGTLGVHESLFNFPVTTATRIYTWPDTSGTVELVTDIASGDILSNITGAPAPAIGNTLSDTFDFVFGDTPGDILYRGASAWEAIAGSGIYLPLTGGTMAGIIDMGNHRIINLAEPESLQDAVTLHYVSLRQGYYEAIAASTTALTVTYSNGTAGVGATITNADTQAAWVLDGVTLGLGETVLIKDQASSFQNGLYTVTNIGSISTNWVATRVAQVYDESDFIKAGDTVVVSQGTTNALTQWMQNNSNITIGTDPITFSKLGASISPWIAGSGLDSAYGGGATDGGATYTLAWGKGAKAQNSGSQVWADHNGSPVLDSGVDQWVVNFAGGYYWYINGIKALTLTPTASAVNYVDILQNITSYAPVISAQGSDTNINLSLRGKGNGGVPLKGTTDGSLAYTGYVGELLTFNLNFSSAISLTTATTADIGSIPLPAGDWDVFGNAGLTASIGATQFVAWLSTTSATPIGFSGCNVQNGTAIISCNNNVPVFNVNSTAPTTVYLSCTATFASGTAGGYGKIYARRIR